MVHAVWLGERTGPFVAVERRVDGHVADGAHHHRASGRLRAADDVRNLIGGDEQVAVAHPAGVLQVLGSAVQVLERHRGGATRAAVGEDLHRADRERPGEVDPELLSERPAVPDPFPQLSFHAG